MAQGVTRSGLAFSVLGSGPPLLWLSGYVVAVAATEQFVRRFAPHYTCIVFDPRGSGRTPPSRLPLTTARMAYDALEVLHETGHASAHVHGISLGGMVAQELVIRAPHRVRALILGSTSAGGRAATPSSLPNMWTSLHGAAGSLPGIGEVSWRGAMHQACAAARHDATSRLGRVQAPTLVMHGARDALLPPVNAGALTTLLPHAELRILEGMGHFYPIEAPELSADLVLSWLRDHDEAPPGSRPGRKEVTRDLAAAPMRLLHAQLLPLQHAYRSIRMR